RKEIERADIVQSREVILVRMRVHYRIEVSDIFPQHLITEIRTSIHDQRGTFRLHEYTRAQALVALIRGSADFAIACDHWHPGTCAGAEHGDGQWRAVHLTKVIS